MTAVYINLAFEDSLSEAVIRQMLVQSGRSYKIHRCFSNNGNGYLRAKIDGFNQASKYMPFLVLTDLDSTYNCPIELRNDWLPLNKQHSNLLFRIAVKEVESWVLAHRNAFSKFLGITKDLIPIKVDELRDPKQTLINLAKRCRYREIREGIIPRLNSTAKQGPDYNGQLVRFVEKNWNVNQAKINSPSLYRSLEAVKRFNPILPQIN